MEEENTLSIVDEAKKVRDEIKAENDRRQKILADEEKLRVEEMLAGNGAMVKPAVVSPDELKKKDAMDMFKGTGIDKAIEKYNG